MLLFLKNLLFTILVPGTVAFYLPVVAFSHPDAEWSLGAALGGLAVFFGACIYLWCLWDFAFAGRGTPAPIDAPKNLVVRGLYRYTRNPMYVGVLAAVFGWALIFRSMQIAYYGLALAVFFHMFVVLYEEPHLRQTFGLNYDEYCAKVSRWWSFRNVG